MIFTHRIVGGLFGLVFAVSVLCPIDSARAEKNKNAREELLPFYSNDGIAGLVRRLRRVESGIRVLHIAAHPDDEDSALLAWLSLGKGARVTYLSLTRGEGGQNLIGPERGAELGVLRTSELLAARELDGAAQLFGRMIDFGFSKSPEECFENWGKENVVEDIVRAIRLTRPHVIICRFQGTPQDGHGQHQASAIAAREAYDKAADPNYKPEMAEKGLAPWQVQKFYVGSFDESDKNAIRIDTGDYDPFEGRSYAAIGYRGRSMHRSQDMGMIEYETPMRASAYLLEKAVGGQMHSDAGLFDGLAVEHEDLRVMVGGLADKWEPGRDTQSLAPRIARLLNRWRREADGDVESENDLQHALAISLGLRLEALSKDSALVVDGGDVKLVCNAYLPSASSVSDWKWTFQTGNGVTTRPVDDPSLTIPLAEGPNAILQSMHTATADKSARPTSPSYLQGGGGDGNHLYNPMEASGLPFDPPALSAIFSASHEGEKIALRIPVEYRKADPAFGEIREDLPVLPGLVAHFARRDLVINRALRRTAEVSAEFRNLSLRAIDEWVRLLNSGETAPTVLRLPVAGRGMLSWDNLPRDPAPGAERRAMSMAVSEVTHEAPILEVSRVDYRHIRPVVVCRPAEVRLHAMDVVLPRDVRLGYVPGAKDDVPNVLSQLGFEVSIIDEKVMAEAALEWYPAIVIGARAYEVRPDLETHHARLMSYVENGGTLVVQYNQYEFADKNLAPLRFKMRRPHDRVTDENAPVMILDQSHSVFHFPNEITGTDFDGWIQERGLYFWSEWDAQYQSLISCADPGEPQQKGGLLHLAYGRGHYIYTGYSFFRQLPAGHEGAAKLFVNLISAGRAPGIASK